MSSEVAEEIPQVKLPDPQQTVVELNVTELIDCGHFWAHYGDEMTWSKMAHLHTEIQNRTAMFQVGGLVIYYSLPSGFDFVII